MEYSFIIPAFIAGLLTFLAPCTLPLVPAYLGFISGVTLDDLKNPETARRARAKIFLNGLAFVIGWSAVFIVLGTLFGFVGSALGPYRVWLARIGGLFVILFGLFMLNVLKLPFLAREATMPMPGLFQRGNPLNSLILGTAFGAGWTPCVGPILGSILLLASTASTALAGGLLLTVFSAGLAIPFLAIALGVGSASRFIERNASSFAAISAVGGIFLILLGVFLVTGTMSVLISSGYRLFRFLEYERLLNYL